MNENERNANEDDSFRRPTAPLWMRRGAARLSPLLEDENQQDWSQWRAKRE
jgi:hypothetical protein